MISVLPVMAVMTTEAVGARASAEAGAHASEKHAGTEAAESAAKAHGA
jgi:hypothetical protein